MDLHEIESRIKSIDERTTRIEQILPTLATKEDVKACPTREEMWTAIREEGTITRAHFDVVAEGLRESIKGIAEGTRRIAVTAQGADANAVIAENLFEIRQS